MISKFFNVTICLLAFVWQTTYSHVSNGDNRWSLADKNCLVTGGSKGIGKAIVEELLSHGANKVITCCRNQDELDSCIADIKSKGYDCISGIVADVGSSEGRNKLIEYVDAECDGKLDCLINNVGFNIRKSTLDYSEDDYHRVMQTNLESSFFLTQAFHPLLKQSKRASVVNIASVAGGASVSIKSGIVYAMTKAAMGQLTYNLACEWAKDNIRVNVVSPWYIETPLVTALLANPEYLKGIVDRTPLRRVGQVSEVSPLVAFLCMDTASYITGQNICVDGGFVRYGFW